MPAGDWKDDPAARASFAAAVVLGPTAASATSSTAGLWNEFIQRYHPWAIASRSAPACATSSKTVRDTRYLEVRDRWIGWQDQPRRPLERVVRRARFLLFP